MEGVIQFIRASFEQSPPFSEDADITVYRDFVNREYGFLLNSPERGKDNAKARSIRQEGNVLLQAKEYEEAHSKFNESICYAETGSEDLAIGYANRSALFYERGNYELALFNIALAKKNRYPERLMPKLQKREQSCKEKIDPNLKTPPITQLQTVKDPNPRIPFLAKGIAMKEFPEFGRGLVAEKDFAVGEVILNEKPLLTSIDRSLCYDQCARCTKGFPHILIPCPNCVYYMYCSEECLEEDKKYVHRFECGVATKLFNLSNKVMFIGSKFFLYGLSLFNDNLMEMMDFCRGARDIPERRFTLDYTNYDRLEEFKALHAMKVKEYSDASLLVRLIVATLYHTYMKSPLVRSICTTKAKKDLFLHLLFKYTEVLASNVVITNRALFGVLSPIANLINHSCDPNATYVAFSGRFKMVLVRPVREGEQIFCTYGPTWWQPDLAFLMLDFTCACTVCKLRKEHKWETTIRKKAPAGMIREAEALLAINRNKKESAKAQLEPMKLFIERYAYVHPQKEMAEVYNAYDYLIIQVTVQEMQALAHAGIAKSVI